MKRTKNYSAEAFRNQNGVFALLLVIGVFLLLISPKFLTEGMFFDGVLYSSVAHAMSNDIGSFWNPYILKGEPFIGHPPLVYWLQSLFFRVLGDSWYVDKIYSICTVIVSGFILFLIWKELRFSIRSFWLVLLLWIITPTVFWAAPNNLLENTMNIFTLLSVLMYLKSRKQLRVVYTFLSGVMLFLAFLCKGFTGIYPLVLPIFYWLFMRDRKFGAACLDTMLVLLGLCLPALVIFGSSPVARESMETYINSQVLRSIESVTTVNSRFYIVLHFLIDMIPAMVVVLLLFLFVGRKRGVKRQSRNFKLFCVFLCLSLAGVLPIMVSLKQRSFYILTVFPLMALSLGCLVEPWLKSIRFLDRRTLVFRVISIVILTLSIGVNIYFCGRIGRDKEMLTDIHALLPHIPEGTTVGACHSMARDYQFMSYMVRYRNVKMMYDHEEFPYWIGRAGAVPEDTSFHYVETDARKHQLYARDVSHE
ncbi:MAG: glycosyltransferase family 39 protein [Bacteroidales bacterium]|nr:glycosyltransferase family 39 protein [Bacteroidales bacterium]